MADLEKSTQNGQNGQSSSNGANGHHANGTASASKAAPSSSGSGPKTKKAGLVKSLLTLRQASRRPLPTEMGDGSYRVVRQRPTLRQDLKSFGKDGEFLPRWMRRSVAERVAR